MEFFTSNVSGIWPHIYLEGSILARSQARSGFWWKHKPTKRRSKRNHCNFLSLLLQLKWVRSSNPWHSKLWKISFHSERDCEPCTGGKCPKTDISSKPWFSPYPRAWSASKCFVSKWGSSHWPWVSCWDQRGGPGHLHLMEFYNIYITCIETDQAIIMQQISL